MEFKSLYIRALRQHDPQLFNELVRTSKIAEHLQQKSEEAHELLRQVLQGNPNPSLAQERAAEEIVRATLIEFPAPRDG
jgi:hypothetical protein